MILRLAVSCVLGASLLAGTAQGASAQQVVTNSRRQGQCVLRKEPNGLIRGGSAPRGCVLVAEDDSAPRAEPSAPAIVCAETHFLAPDAEKVALTNCRRLSRGQIAIPTVPATEQVITERQFGPLQRHFGPLQRHFGPLERNFGALERHFGPLQRNFGSSSQSQSTGSQP